MTRGSAPARDKVRLPKLADPADPEAVAAYSALIDELKLKVSGARLRAALAANRELILLYWDIGRAILDRQAELGWGVGVVQRVAGDLRKAFPEIKGFAPRNVRYMRAFADAWPDREIVQRTVAQLPWGHQHTLLDKLDDPDVRLFYIRRAVEHGWSRPVLAVQIETQLHERSGGAVTNFEHALPPPASDLARDTLKDPYVFEFAALAAGASERELEQSLMDHLQKFLLELGVGFAFVGRQFHLEVGGDDFFVDLLFYHYQLRCFVVIELKVVPFEPEFAGKLNFYLSVVDGQLKHPQDQPTIGLLLCKDKNRVVVEYALDGIAKPMGVASWRSRDPRTLPNELTSALPSVQQIEQELAARRGPTDG
jgi:predicted nuclease of restriction endonuclease-like (RecB) superfamily